MPRKQPPSTQPPRARKVQAKRVKEKQASFSDTKLDEKPAPYWADGARKAEEGGLVDPGVYAGPFTGDYGTDTSDIDDDDDEPGSTVET